MANPFLMRLDRGVYNAPYESRDGHHIMFSVTHDHRRLTEAVVLKDSDMDGIRQVLQDELDRDDPVRSFPKLISAFLRA